MAKHFSKQYGNKGWAFDYPVSAIWNKFLLCQDACQCLMLHPYISASRTIINIVLPWVEFRHWTLKACRQPCRSRVVRYICHLLSIHAVYYFSSCLDVRSDMQVIATQVCIILNTPFAGLPLSLIAFQRVMDWSFSCLFWRQWCRDVASGIFRHLDRTEIYFRLQIQGNQQLIPCFHTF